MSLQSKVTFVPGKKRASAAGVICAGAGNVVEGGGVAVGTGVGAGVGTGVGEGGATAPGVTVILADCDALPTIA